MKKPKSNNSKEKIKKAPGNGQKNVDHAAASELDGYSDFGGLPIRDLKKNLGCG
jgi:hypothetical protein